MTLRVHCVVTLFGWMLASHVIADQATQSAGNLKEHIEEVQSEVKAQSEVYQQELNSNLLAFQNGSPTQKASAAWKVWQQSLAQCQIAGEVESLRQLDFLSCRHVYEQLPLVVLNDKQKKVLDDSRTFFVSAIKRLIIRERKVDKKTREKMLGNLAKNLESNRFYLGASLFLPHVARKSLDKKEFERVIKSLGGPGKRSMFEVVVTLNSLYDDSEMLSYMKAMKNHLKGFYKEDASMLAFIDSAIPETLDQESLVTIAQNILSLEQLISQQYGLTSGSVKSWIGKKVAEFPEILAQQDHSHLREAAAL